MPDKILSFRIDVEGVSNEAKAIAKIEIELSKLNEERRKANKLAKEGKITRKQQADELARITSQTIKLRAEKQKLTKAERDNNRAMDKSTKSTNTFGKAISSFLFKANFLANVMSNVASAIKRAFVRGLKDAIRIVIDFNKAMTEVRAISQATDEEFQLLRQSAKDLGRSTKFTAAEVAGLQKEYAKLGFTINTVIELQDATLDLATATGSDLAEAALVVGGAMRVFRLGMSKAKDVAATLAIATTKSALAFEDYENILSNLAPISSAYGFTLEETLGLMGQLKNANFDTSRASTAFKNILLNLANTSGKLNQRLGGNINSYEDLIKGLIRLREEGISLNEMLLITDRRSVGAFKTFLDGAENALVLKDAITDVSGELEIMVDLQLQSLENQLILLKSAYQGLVIGMVGSEETIDSGRNKINKLTGAVQKLGDAFEDPTRTSFGEALINSTILLIPTFLESLNRTKEAIFGVKEAEEEWTGGGGSMEAYYKARTEEAEALALVLKLEKEAQEALALAAKIAKPILVGINEEIKRFQDLQLAATTEEQVKQYALEIKALQDKKRELTQIADLETKSEFARKKALESIPDLLKELKNELINEDPIDISESLIDPDGFENVLDKTKEATKVIIDGIKVIDDASKASSEEQLKDDERTNKLKLRFEEQFTQKKVELANSTFDILSALNDHAIQQNSLRFEQGLINEKEFADESLKLKRRQAIFDRAQAIFNIGVDTAVKAGAAAAGVLTAPLVPFIIAAGVAAAVAVLAVPLPQFAGSGIVPGGHELPQSTAQGDNTLILAKPGEVYLNEDHQAALGGADTFRKIGVPGFASGGRVPSISAPSPLGNVDIAMLASMISRAFNDKQVVLNVNDLNSANDDLSVINDTNQL